MPRTARGVIPMIAFDVWTCVDVNLVAL